MVADPAQHFSATKMSDHREPEKEERAILYNWRQESKHMAEAKCRK